MQPLAVFGFEADGRESTSHDQGFFLFILQKEISWFLSLSWHFLQLSHGITWPSSLGHTANETLPLPASETRVLV